MVIIGRATSDSFEFLVFSARELSLGIIKRGIKGHGL